VEGGKITNKKEDLEIWMKWDPASLKIEGLANLVWNGLLCSLKCQIMAKHVHYFMVYCFNYTVSVACVVGPKWTHYKIGNSSFAMYVSIFWTAKYERKSCLNWMVSLQVLPRAQLTFPSKSLFLRIHLNFQWQKSL
jgi:hypothetical protein